MATALFQLHVAAPDKGWRAVEHRITNASSVVVVVIVLQLQAHLLTPSLVGSAYCGLAEGERTKRWLPSAEYSKKPLRC